MKYLFTITVLFLFSFQSFSQSKNFIDQPYLETLAQVDTTVTPDRIYLNIILNEKDSRNKQSTEELEKGLKDALTTLEIDFTKQLKLNSLNSYFRKYFLSNTKILKTKVFSLLVYDAITAGNVLSLLEEKDIANVHIEKMEYSKSDELQLSLKSKAILKAQTNAKTMSESLNQKLGKALYITDLEIGNSNKLQGITPGIRIRGLGQPGSNANYSVKEKKELTTEFNKIQYFSKVNVKFALE